MFLTKIAMLTMFILGVTFGWASITMQFSVSLYNILLGILSMFFLLRGFEFADKINMFGPYSEKDMVEKVEMKPADNAPEKEDPQE